MTDLLALADEIVALPGPSREMDERIWVAFHPELSPRVGAWVGASGKRRYLAPELTASIDAALALQPVGYVCTLCSYSIISQMPTADFCREGHFERYYATAHTLPLAICVAAILAAAAIEAER